MTDPSKDTLSIAEIEDPDRMSPADAVKADCWFAVQTKPRYERIAAHLLSEKDLECFFPTYPERRRWSDRTKTLDKPLFPSYLFCRAELGAVNKVLLTSGVSRIVGFGNQPAPIPDSEIEAIQKLVASGLVVRPHEYLKVGCHVRLHTGPLAGTQGLVIGRKNDCRFIVSVGLLRRSVSVELDPRWLERVSPPPQWNSRRSGLVRQKATA